MTNHQLAHLETETVRALALLKRDTADGPVFFVIDHRHYRPQTEEEKQEHDRYLFEEHSCPTNWLRDCIAVIEDGDTDPHGVLDFVRTVEVPDGFEPHDRKQLQELFPEAFERTQQDAAPDLETRVAKALEAEMKAWEDVDQRAILHDNYDLRSVPVDGALDLHALARAAIAVFRDAQTKSPASTS